MCKKLTAIGMILMLLIAILTMTTVNTSAEETVDPTDTFVDDETEEPSGEAATEALVAPAADANVIYFDPTGSGWKDYDSICFHIWEIDDDSFTDYLWGSRMQLGKQSPDGRWYYDFDEHGLTIKKGKQYGVVFYAKQNNTSTSQTYNLIFGKECIGKTASCDKSVYENPEDSHKTTQVAYWDDSIDPTVYGPELQITSIGTVVGTCCPASTTPYDLFVGFLHNSLQNARIYANKSDQQLIDDIGIALSLSRNDVDEAIIESGLDIDWDYAASAIPEDASAGTEEPTQAQETAGATEDANKAQDHDKDADNTDDKQKSPNTGDAAPLYVLLIVSAAIIGVILSEKQLRKAN